VVSMGARAADVYDLLAAARPAGVELWIRAAWDRCVQAPERSVWATVEAQPVVAPLLLQVPRRDTQPAREATLALRCCRLTLCPPRHRQAEGLPEVVLWAVQVRKVDAPAAVRPIAWLRLTTGAVDRVEDASDTRPMGRVSLGHGGLAPDCDKWLSHGSAPVGHGRALGALFDALQRHGLAGVFCCQAGPGGARAAV
jgi:hypothetical protein